MKRLATGFGMAAILLVASTPGQTPPTAPRSISNSLEVLVTAGGNPLPDVDVTVTSTPEPSSSTAVPVTTTTTRTTSDGRAVFRNLPAGNYGVRTERQGY